MQQPKSQPTKKKNTQNRPIHIVTNMQPPLSPPQQQHQQQKQEEHGMNNHFRDHLVDEAIETINNDTMKKSSSCYSNDGPNNSHFIGSVTERFRRCVAEKNSCCGFLAGTFSASIASDNDSSTTQRRQRQRAIALFGLTIVLLFADQNLMAPNLSAIAKEYGFSDNERDRKLGGDIALAFWLLGAPASLLVGCLGDVHHNHHHDATPANHNNRQQQQEQRTHGDSGWQSCCCWLLSGGRKRFPRVPRPALFAIVVAMGESACLLTYWSSTYRQLYVCRAITGFSIGGAVPLIYSLLGDYFAANERHTVNAVVATGTGLGILVGQGISGFVGPTLGWRMPFVIVSVPAIVCAVAVFLVVEDPERGQMEQAVLQFHQQQQQLTTTNDKNTQQLQQLQQQHQQDKEQQEYHLFQSPPLPQITTPPPSQTATTAVFAASAAEKHHHHNNSDNWWTPHWRTLRFLLSTPSVVLAIVQGAPGCLPWGIVNTYLNDFLSEDRGMSVEYATLVMLFFGIGCFFGLVIGGACGDYLYQKDKRYPQLLASGSTILSCFPFWLLLNGVSADDQHETWYIALVALVAGICPSVGGPIVKATLQNVTIPESRGQAFAVSNIFNDIGVGLGPVVVSVLITRLGGRTVAFNVGTLGWMVCGFMNLVLFFTVETDERKTQEQVYQDHIIIQLQQQQQELATTAGDTTTTIEEGKTVAAATSSSTPAGYYGSLWW